jgi:DNA modification methylase
MGSGTTAVAAETLNRKWIGIELSENYTNIAKERVKPFVVSNQQLKLDI